MVQTTTTVGDLTSASPTSRRASPGHLGNDQAKLRRRSLYLNDIWRLARQKWEAAGRPDGDSSRFWLEAEQELLQAEGINLGEFSDPTAGVVDHGRAAAK